MLQTTPTPINNGICSNVYNTGAAGFNKLGLKAQSAAASAGEALGKIWASVSAFFSSIIQTIAHYMNRVKEGLWAAKDQVVALPKETKVLGIALLVLATVMGVWAGKTYSNTPTVPAETTAATTTPAASTSGVENKSIGQPSANQTNGENSVEKVLDLTKDLPKDLP